MLNQHLPTVVCHADSGSDPGKRWLGTAVLEGSRYIAHPPEPVGDHTTLIARVRGMIGHGSAMVGFDFSIGIPASYARLIGATEFKTFHSQLGRGTLADFYRVCSDALEITKYVAGMSGRTNCTLAHSGRSAGVRSRQTSSKEYQGWYAQPASSNHD
jgi:hypothetical protein